jgi:BON domain
MAQSAAPPTLPSRGHAGEEEHAPLAAAPLSTQRLEELPLAGSVKRALHATGRGALCGVEVSVRARVAFLGGRVPSYYLKQVAQAVALAVPGIQHICNDLEVT